MLSRNIKDIMCQGCGDVFSHPIIHKDSGKKKYCPICIQNHQREVVRKRYHERKRLKALVG